MHFTLLLSALERGTMSFELQTISAVDEWGTTTMLATRTCLTTILALIVLLSIRVDAQNPPGLLANHFPLRINQQQCLRRADAALRAAGMANPQMGSAFGIGGTLRSLYVIIHCVTCGNDVLVDVSLAVAPGSTEGDRMRECLSQYMMNGRSSCWGGAARPGTLCRTFEETEDSGWKAVFTRRGNTDVYDATFTGPGGQTATTVNTVKLQGNRISIERTWSSDGNLCTYDGTVQPDGVSVQGRYSCQTGGMRSWSAPSMICGAGGGAGAAAGGAAAGGICANPETQAIMDEWLARALPPQKAGEALRYESWGRIVGRSRSATIAPSASPDTRLSRCEWLWHYSSAMRSSNGLGTLREYVERRQ